MYKLIMFLFLIGCQTVQQKNMNLVNGRADNLNYLTHWRPSICRVRTELTAPASARYQQLFPDEATELAQKSRDFVWKSDRDACEVQPKTSTPLSESLKAFINQALCTLLQVHWVNSPFADLDINPDDVVRTGDERVQIRVTPKDPHLGVYLDPEKFVIETKTKSRGTLVATYGLVNHEWVPQRLEESAGKSKIIVDDIDYDTHRMHGRSMIKSFWISAGETVPVHHTFVTIEECQ